MKKRISIILATLLSVSVLFSFGACTKTKTPSEQFKNAAISAGQYFLNYLKAGLLLPDYSEAKGLEQNLSFQFTQQENGVDYSLGELVLHGIEDIASKSVAWDGSVTVDEEKMPITAYLTKDLNIFVGFPEVGEKYLTILSDKHNGGSGLKKLMDTVAAQITDTSISSEKVEYEVNGAMQKGVTKLTFAADETQRKAISDALWEIAEKDEVKQLSQFSITFYVYRDQTVAINFDMAQNDNDKVSANLTMQNKDGKDYALKGNISIQSEEDQVTLSLDGTQTVTDSGRTGTLAVSLDADDSVISVKADYTDTKDEGRKTVANQTSCAVSFKSGTTTVSVEMPMKMNYTVDNNKISGTIDCSGEMDTIKLAVHITFNQNITDGGKVIIPEISDENRIVLADATQDSAGLTELLSELQTKYPTIFGTVTDPVDPDAKYPVFYLSNEETGEGLDFYEDNTGMVTSYVLFEQTDGKAVITLDGNGSQVGFTFKPFGTEGYTLNQTVQLEDLTFNAAVTENEITLTNEEIGWTFWFMPEQAYGTFQRSFTYTKTDSSIQIQVQPNGSAQEIQKIDDDTYSLNGIEYQYSNASDFAD